MGNMPNGTIKGILDGSQMPDLEPKHKDTVNMTIPIIISTMTMCNICDSNITNEEELWRCELYCDFDLCAKCHDKGHGVDHPHKLVTVPTKDRNKHNADTHGVATVTEMKDMLNLLKHGSRCQVQDCPFPNCRKVKWLINHGATCPRRTTENCSMCKKVNQILRLHASACSDPDCRVPHCKEMREKFQKVKQFSDACSCSNGRGLSRRERMKQRIEEASRTKSKETKKAYQAPGPQEKAIYSGFLFVTLAVLLNKQSGENK